MRVGILNVYDGRNSGDRAIVEAQKTWLSKKLPGAEIRVFSHHFEQNARIWKDKSIRSLVDIPPEAEPLERLIAPIRDWLAFRLGWRGEYDREFLSCDLYALCGGGYLYSSLSPVISRNLWVHCINALEALRTGKPVLQFPQSFGPISKRLDSFIIRKLAEKLPVAVPRDESSANFLESTGFGSKSILVPDIVFGLRHIRPDWFLETDTRTGLGIAPVNFRFAMPTTPRMVDEYIAKLVQVGVDYHEKTNEEIYIFSQVTVTGKDDDCEVANRLYRALKEKGLPVIEVPKEERLEDHLAHFRTLRVFVGCRMHSCIFSFINGVPTLGLSYQPKFLGSFQHIGRPDWTQPITEWTPQWANDRIDDILNNELETRRYISEKNTELATRVDQGLTEVLRRSQMRDSV